METKETDPILQMDDITVRFPGVLALDKVHLDVKAGEVHVLLGENGAGKSTIMKVLAGVYSSYSGKIVLKGKEIRARSIIEQRDRGISIIFQEMNLLKNLFGAAAEDPYRGR
jgi:ribose transport system ATP-binding protein